MMRPDRFEKFTVKQLAAHPAVGAAAPLRDQPGPNGARYPYGVAVRWAAGGEHRWQITAESAPGDRYDRPEEPGKGDPAPAVDEPDPAGPVSDRDAEQLLAHILAAAGSPEFADVDCWSRRPGALPGRRGLTVRCHTGARLYLRAPGATGAR